MTPIQQEASCPTSRYASRNEFVLQRFGTIDASGEFAPEMLPALSSELSTPHAEGIHLQLHLHRIEYEVTVR